MAPPAVIIRSSGAEAARSHGSGFEHHDGAHGREERIVIDPGGQLRQDHEDTCSFKINSPKAIDSRLAWTRRLPRGDREKVTAEIYCNYFLPDPGYRLVRAIAPRESNLIVHLNEKIVRHGIVARFKLEN